MFLLIFTNNNNTKQRAFTHSPSELVLVLVLCFNAWRAQQLSWGDTLCVRCRLALGRVTCGRSQGSDIVHDTIYSLTELLCTQPELQGNTSWTTTNPSLWCACAEDEPSSHAPSPQTLTWMNSNKAHGQDMNNRHRTHATQRKHVMCTQPTLHFHLKRLHQGLELMLSLCFGLHALSEFLSPAHASKQT